MMALNHFSDAEDSDDWEYEHDEKLTEEIFVTVDLSTYPTALAQTAPETKTRKRKHQKKTASTEREQLLPTPACGPEPLDRSANGDVAALINTDGYAGLPGGVSKKRQTEDKLINKSEKPFPHLQILEFLSKQPLINFKDQIYTCEWASTIGTQLILTPKDRFHRKKTYEPLVSTAQYCVVATSRLRLVAKPATLVPKTWNPTKSSADLPSTQISPNSVSNLETTEMGSNLVVADESEKTFLDRLCELKARLGQTDNPRAFRLKDGAFNGGLPSRPSSTVPNLTAKPSVYNAFPAVTEMVPSSSPPRLRKRRASRPLSPGLYQKSRVMVFVLHSPAGQALLKKLHPGEPTTPSKKGRPNKTSQRVPNSEGQSKSTSIEESKNKQAVAHSGPAGGPGYSQFQTQQTIPKASFGPTGTIGYSQIQTLQTIPTAPLAHHSLQPNANNFNIQRPITALEIPPTLHANLGPQLHDANVFIDSQRGRAQELPLVPQSRIHRNLQTLPHSGFNRAQNIHESSPDEDFSAATEDTFRVLLNAPNPILNLAPRLDNTAPNVSNDHGSWRPLQQSGTTQTTTPQTASMDNISAPTTWSLKESRMAPHQQSMSASTTLGSPRIEGTGRRDLAISSQTSLQNPAPALPPPGQTSNWPFPTMTVPSYPTTFPSQASFENHVHGTKPVERGVGTASKKLKASTATPRGEVTDIRMPIPAPSVSGFEVSTSLTNMTQSEQNGSMPTASSVVAGSQYGLITSSGIDQLIFTTGPNPAPTQGHTRERPRGSKKVPTLRRKAPPAECSEDSAMKQPESIVVQTTPPVQNSQVNNTEYQPDYTVMQAISSAQSSHMSNSEDQPSADYWSPGALNLKTIQELGPSSQYANIAQKPSGTLNNPDSAAAYAVRYGSLPVEQRPARGRGSRGGRVMIQPRVIWGPGSRGGRAKRVTTTGLPTERGRGRGRGRASAVDGVGRMATTTPVAMSPMAAFIGAGPSGNASSQPMSASESAAHVGGRQQMEPGQE